ncbi:MAG: hypothetical protein WC502_11600, partial [Methanolinea sp.]
CSKCKREAILYQPYSGQHLCREHLVADIEAKAKRTIRQHRGMLPGDHIAVILSGNAVENALLFFLRKLTGKRKDIQVSGIPAGITDDFFALASRAGATRIAVATTLDEMSVEILSGILRGDPRACLPGTDDTGETLPTIAPFCYIPSEEIARYARIHDLEGRSPLETGDDDSRYSDIKRLLGEYTSRHPAAPYAIINLCDSLKTAGWITSYDGTHPDTEQLMKKSR